MAISTAPVSRSARAARSWSREAQTAAPHSSVRQHCSSLVAIFSASLRIAALLESVPAHRQAAYARRWAEQLGLIEA